MTFASLVDAGLVQVDVTLADLTTYKFGGAARYFCDAGSDSDLVAVATALAAEPMEVLLVGRGSNLVVSDAGFDGLALRLGNAYSYVEAADDFVDAGGATPLPKLARAAVAAGRGGLEFYVGIPGSVGGAVCMNAGGHGSATAEWLRWARVFDLTTGSFSRRDSADLGLGYRQSSLTPATLVTAAAFHTVAIAPKEGEKLMREISHWRKVHQPGGTLNAGSVFRNPTGDAAAPQAIEPRLLADAAGGITGGAAEHAPGIERAAGPAALSPAAGRWP